MRGREEAEGRERQDHRHRLHLLAGLAIDVDLARLGVGDRLAAGGRGAHPYSCRSFIARDNHRRPDAGAAAHDQLRGAAAMRAFLLFHGYMLRGTGSNIYNANLARALARLGHEVHLALPGPRGPDRGRRDPQPRHRRPAPGLRQGPLRGLRGEGLPGADRRGARPLHRGQRRRCARGRRTRPAASTPPSPTTW